MYYIVLSDRYYIYYIVIYNRYKLNIKMVVTP